MFGMPVVAAFLFLKMFTFIFSAFLPLDLGTCSQFMCADPNCPFFL